jgi:hypothetical protein
VGGIVAAQVWVQVCAIRFAREGWKAILSTVAREAKIVPTQSEVLNRGEVPKLGSGRMMVMHWNGSSASWVSPLCIRQHNMKHLRRNATVSPKRRRRSGTV